jgi:hypothetical protein
LKYLIKTPWVFLKYFFIKSLFEGFFLLILLKHLNVRIQLLSVLCFVLIMNVPPKCMTILILPMSRFDRSSLRYDYSWSEIDKAKIHGIVSDDNVIDRDNGYQVLDFMNRFFQMSGLMTLDSFHRLENLIKKHMPEKNTTRGEMKNWLGKNWNKRI